MDRYISLDPVAFEELESGLEDAIICACSRRSLPQFVATADANGCLVRRLTVEIDQNGRVVILPIPNCFGQAEMTDLQLLVASGLEQCGFEGYFLTGSPYKIGSVANG